MKKVVVEMTMEQAAANARALDLFSRVLLGQFNVVAELFRQDDLMARDPVAPGKGREVTLEEMRQADQLCLGLKRLLGFDEGASHGVGSRAVSIDAHRSYEVLCVLQKALAMERNPQGRSVHHDGLRLRYTDDPAPVATVQVGERGDEDECVELKAASDVLATWAAKNSVQFVSRSHGQCTTATISKDALLDLCRAGGAK